MLATVAEKYFLYYGNQDRHILWLVGFKEFKVQAQVKWDNRKLDSYKAYLLCILPSSNIFPRPYVFFLPARITGNFTSIQSASAATFSPTSSPSGVRRYSTCGGTTG